MSVINVLRLQEEFEIGVSSKASSSHYLQSRSSSDLAVCIPHMQTSTESGANYLGSEPGVQFHLVGPHHQDS